MGDKRERDALDKVLEVGSSFDWIGPMIDLIRTNDWATYAYPEEVSDLVYLVVWDLRADGIPVRGHAIYGNMVTFSVQWEDVAFADDALRDWGLMTDEEVRS